MLLDEAIDTSEIEDFRKEQDSLRQAIDENRKRFRFKENLAIGFSEFLFKEFDYSKAKAFCGLIQEWYELMDVFQDRVCGVEEIKQIIPLLSRLCIETINLPEPE